MAIDEDKAITEQVSATEYNTIAETVNDITDNGLPQKLKFVGTDHEGIVVISLTTTERNALTGVGTGAIIWNSTTTQLEFYNGLTWSAIGAGGASPLTTKGDLYTYSTTDARLPVGADGQIVSADSTQATGLKWIDPTAGAGAPATFERTFSGNVSTGQLIPIPIPDELAGLDIKEVRLALTALPAGQALKVDVRKSGTATTNSIFTSDVEIEVGTAQSATNGLYMTGCNTSGSTVGTPGTTIDAAQDTLSADDVLYIYVTQVGSTTAGANLVVTISVA